MHLGKYTFGKNIHLWKICIYEIYICENIYLWKYIFVKIYICENVQCTFRKINIQEKYTFGKVCIWENIQMGKCTFGKMYIWENINLGKCTCWKYIWDPSYLWCRFRFILFRFVSLLIFHKYLAQTSTRNQSIN